MSVHFWHSPCLKKVSLELVAMHCGDNFSRQLDYRNRLQEVQSTAFKCTSGALRTILSDALNTLFFLPLLDFVGKHSAGNAVARLAATNQWLNLGLGPSTIRLDLGPNKPIDYCLNDPYFKMWIDNIPGRKNCLCFFTNGSKLDDKIGYGVCCKEAKVSVSARFPNHCTVFQAEILTEVAAWLRKNVTTLR